MARHSRDRRPNRLAHRHSSRHPDMAFENASKMEGTGLLGLWFPNLGHSGVSDACCIPRGTPLLGRAPVCYHQVSFVPASHDHLLSSVRDDTESKTFMKSISWGLGMGGMPSTETHASAKDHELQTIGRLSTRKTKGDDPVQSESVITHPGMDELADGHSLSKNDNREMIIRKDIKWSVEHC